MSRASEIINAISEEIAVQQRACAEEREYPGSNSDKMDAKIKTSREIVKKLREIREQLEIVLYGEIE